jgi:hypothetical protein
MVVAAGRLCSLASRVERAEDERTREAYIRDSCIRPLKSRVFLSPRRSERTVHEGRVNHRLRQEEWCLEGLPGWSDNWQRGQFEV